MKFQFVRLLAFPAGSGALPAGFKPLPAGVKALPASSDALQVGFQPLPVGSKPHPTGFKPLPAGLKPLPTGSKVHGEGLDIPSLMGILSVILTSFLTFFTLPGHSEPHVPTEILPGPPSPPEALSVKKRSKIDMI